MNWIKKLAVKLARSYVNGKYPEAKIGWTAARKSGLELPTDIDKFLDWFFEVG